MDQQCNRGGPDKRKAGGPNGGLSKGVYRKNGDEKHEEGQRLNIVVCDLKSTGGTMSDHQGMAKTKNLNEKENEVRVSQ